MEDRPYSTYMYCSLVVFGLLFTSSIITSINGVIERIKDIADVNQTSSEISDGIFQINQSSNELSGLAKELREMISRFQV